jgi:hypothetical protein
MLLELAILKNFNSGTYKAGVQLAGSLTTYLDDIPISRDIPTSALVVGNRVILAIPNDNPKDACVIATWPQGSPGGAEVHDNDYHNPDFEQQGVAASLVETHRTTETHTQPQPPAEHGNEKHNPDFATDTALSAHEALINPHSSTPDATANRLILRDSSGRAKVAAPSASDDIARKAEVDAKPSIFLQLTDTPDSYSGQSGKVVKVKSTEDGLEFGSAGGGGAPSGTAVLLYNDETDSSETTSSTTETEKKSWTLPANSYAKIIIEAEVRDRVEQDANTKCDFTWRIKVGGVTQKTYVNRIIAVSTQSIDSGGKEVLPLKTIVAGGQTSSTAISITGQMSISNAATGILAHSLRVYGVTA